MAGYYTLTATSVALSALSPDIARRLPRYPVVPAALVGRLAVSRDYQGRGLGGVLLGDALLRAARTELGVFAMLVDAKDETTRSFYQKFNFLPLMGAPNSLFLPMQSIRELAGTMRQ